MMDDATHGGPPDRDAVSHPGETVGPRLTLPSQHDPLTAILHQLSVIVLRHPVAAQAAFAALVAEGRRFARTPEGSRWHAALADSELVRRGRSLWEGSLLNLLEDDPEALLPSSIFDAIVHAASRGELGALSERVFPLSKDDDDSPST